MSVWACTRSFRQSTFATETQQAAPTTSRNTLGKSMIASIMPNEAKQGTQTAFARWVAERFAVRPDEGRLVISLSPSTIGTFIANV